MIRLAALFILAGLPAAAETGYACLFSVECAAAGGCDPVSIETEIASAPEGEWIFLTATADPMQATRLTPPGGVQAFAGFRGDDLATLITINRDGTALNSQHRGDSDAAVFFGTCEAAG